MYKHTHKHNPISRPRWSESQNDRNTINPNPAQRLATFKPLRRSILAASALIPLLTGNPSLAQPSIELDPEVVTAARTNSEVSASLNSVSVINAAEIQQLGINNIGDALRTLAGIEIARTGGRGQQESIFTRGTESDHTLILVDGVRVSSATAGSAALNYIPINQIERIELVRGAHSAAYGADAIGGVIQIFTKQADQAQQHSLSTYAGSESTTSLAYNLAHKGNGNSWSLAVNSENTEGYDVTDGGQTDTDGYYNNGALINFNQSFGERSGLNLSARYSEGNVEFDSSFGGDQTDIELYQFAGELSFPIQVVDSRLLLAQSSDKQTTYSQTIDEDVLQTVRRNLTWENRLAYEQGQLLAGFDWYEDDVSESSSDFTEDSRTNSGLFLQNNLVFGDWRLQTGLRFDDNEIYGDNQTFNLGLGWQLSETISLRASQSSGFRAPTFNDLYSPFGGNEDLEPERSLNTELGLTWNHSAFTAILSLYKNRLTDLISFVQVGEFSFLPFNVQKAEVIGAELELLVNYKKLSNRFSIGINDSENETTGEPLLRRAHQNIKWSGIVDLRPLNLSWSLTYQGDREDFGQQQLPAYWLADARAAYEFTQFLQGYVRVSNLLDDDYQTAAGFNTQGRVAYVGLDLQF